MVLLLLRFPFFTFCPSNFPFFLLQVYISIVELIPTALKYDPQDKYVTVSLLAGMAVMAASLLLFAV